MTPLEISSAKGLKEGPRPSDPDTRREAAIRILLANGLVPNALGLVMSPCRLGCDPADSMAGARGS